MIPLFLTVKQERKLRVEYVNSSGCNLDDYFDYRNYIINQIPGALEVSYRGGDDHNYAEAIVFDSDKNLNWFLLRWSS